MSYFEPPAFFGELAEVIERDPSCTHLRDAAGRTIEISRFSQGLWCVEARTDKSLGGVQRQPFTGLQESLERCSLVTQSKDVTVEIRNNNQCININTSGAQFELVVDGEPVFRTSPAAFKSHDVPVLIQEDLCSLKVTEWSTPTPWRMKPEHYASLMVRFEFPLPQGPIVGLAGAAGEANRRGYRFHLFNNDCIEHSPWRKPLYQSWPIVFFPTLSGRGWVVLFVDNPSRTYVDLGEFYDDKALFESVTGTSRVYIGYADTLAEASRLLCTMFERPLFPPLWAFGYQQCRFSYSSTDEVKQITKLMRAENIPLDVIYFDGDYMDGYRVFTYDQRNFSDIRETIKELKDDGIQSVCIIDPGVRVDPAYPLYQKLLKTGAYLKTENGEPFVAKVWPGRCLMPDFHSKVAADLWSEAQATWLRDVPFSGIWNDMNEPSNFDGFNEKNATAHTERGSHMTEFNLYGLGMARASFAGWAQARPSLRPFLISRSGYPGIQSYSISWHGDNACWWEHLRLAIDFAIQYSLSGLFCTGPDIPGFFGNTTDDHVVRAFQLGAFLPFFRGHSFTFTKDKEPFRFEGHTKRRIKEAIVGRYSLLREYYSLFQKSVQEYKSPFLPIITSSNNLLRDAFLLFDKFAVYPVTNRDEEQRALYLPPGDWYRLGNTATLIQGDSWITEPLSKDCIPVFVRASSIVVRNTPALNTAKTFQLPETYEIYPDKNGNATGYYFEDDGVSVRGQDAIQYTLSWAPSERKVNRTRC